MIGYQDDNDDNDRKMACPVCYVSLLADYVIDI